MEVRQRKKEHASLSQSPGGEPTLKPNEQSQSSPETEEQISYWLTRWLILRFVGLLYAIAFLVALNQGPALVGPSGLLPYPRLLRQAREHFSAQEETAFLQMPTLFWMIPPSWERFAFHGVAGSGLLLSLMILAGRANMVILLLVWALYMSIDNIGQLFWGFGWEIQLLETGFLAAWLCPFLQTSPFPASSPPSQIVLWLFRWLIVRIMLGAGLIKIRGDACWTDLTCLIYHYETQPIPNPLSWWLHHMPAWFHKTGVIVNHLIELIVPFFLVLPVPVISAGPNSSPRLSFSFRPLRLLAGVLFCGFQVMLILSGNLSFLNYLTIIPALACFDDQFLFWLFPFARRWVASHLEKTPPPASSLSSARRAGANWGRRMRFFSTVLFALLVAYLSVPVLRNLVFAEQQAMNANFDRLKLVNTYGAFGSVGKARNEVIIEGTNAADPTSSRAGWLEYEFRCKPGNVSRRPCVVAPYHLRLDWQIWFAAMGRYEQNPWLVLLVSRLLHNDTLTLGLLDSNPFPSAPPKFVRGSLYRYRFSDRGARDWWQRERVREYLPPLSADNPSLQKFVAQYSDA